MPLQPTEFFESWRYKVRTDIHCGRDHLGGKFVRIPFDLVDLWNDRQVMVKNYVGQLVRQNKACLVAWAIGPDKDHGGYAVVWTMQAQPVHRARSKVERHHNNA